MDVSVESSPLAKADLYITTPNPTASISPGTPIDVCSASVTALGDMPAVDFTMVGPGQLRYDGAESKNFEVGGIISMTTGTGNRVISIFVAKNGTVIASSEQTRKVSVAGDVGNASISWSVPLATDDIVEIFVDSNLATTITPEKLRLSVKEQR